MIPRAISIIQHACLGCALVAAIATSGGWGHRIVQASLAAEGGRLDQLRSQLAELKQAPAPREEKPFTRSLPSAAARTDELVHFMSVQARALDVQIASMSVQPSPSNARELGRVQFNISLRGSYMATKTLLNELQERYSSLGVQTLIMRAMPQNAALRETQLTLVWYVKD